MAPTNIVSLTLLNILFHDFLSGSRLPKESSYGLSEHTMVTNSDVFPYVAAIMKKSTYLCAGALIDESWVLTAADSLFLLRDSLRLLRVRLGSINNRKGGTLVPIKYFEIHPYFDDQKPEYDLAMVRLGTRVRLTPSLNPIRIQKMPRKLTATHFIVTAWPTQPLDSQEPTRLESMESIKRRRMLAVAHLHPADPQGCSEHLEELGVTRGNFMCLEPAPGTNPCVRDAGAPVVLNGILWGIVSSWKQEECDLDPAPSLVTLVAPVNTSSWIHATVQGKKWNGKRALLQMSDYDNDYDEE